MHTDKYSSQAVHTVNQALLGYLDQLSSTDTIWSLTRDNLRQVDTSNKAICRIELDNVNNILITTGWVNLQNDSAKQQNEQSIAIKWWDLSRRKRVDNEQTFWTNSRMEMGEGAPVCRNFLKRVHAATCTRHDVKREKSWAEQTFNSSVGSATMSKFCSWNNCSFGGNGNSPVKN